ncbi:hypothetical protein A2714_04760 [Candidatus Woesebacteria bacterium RIFCSPHIGHO2_01_FULL_38_9]|uniref:Uncharacterized protein n=2 Tax=Candidatus Woeseibacteriota TaxID=1752722 RepID=A0A1F7Y0Z2_9BACT|nr:MAG: hypothetical protein A2714_04760 [Candidatus Woesebacteria bacterium RIFCSPHIGHO2_01_FULL_38_9]OGM58858.1 MAG: hypothetical protein A3A75_06360 [Candidatus Woesebacteria bacterium RIFCSPLOWO2_01_FULL_39_10]
MSESAVGITYEAAYCYGLRQFTDYRCLDLANPELFFWLISIALIIVLAAIVFLLIRAWRNKKLPVLYKILISFLGLTCILILFYVEIWNLEHTSYRKIGRLWEDLETSSQIRQVDIPSYAIETANNLIIDQTGRERFYKDIKYNEQETKKVNIAKVLGKATYQVYKIAYNYTPLEILNGSSEDSLFYVDIVDIDSPYYEQHKIIRTRIVNNHLPRCTADPSLCDFHLTRKEAIQIANKNGFKATDLSVSWNSWEYQKLTIKLTSCAENKAMYLDYRDGSVIKFQDEVICGGVF